MKYIKYRLLSFLLILSCAGFAQEMTLTEDFKQDTALVEQKMREMIDQNPSTFGMSEAASEYEKGYDELLNKYYKLLREKLNDDGKKALTDAQRNWIKFRDSETELITELVRNAAEENGGGSIWGVIGINTQVEVTRRRVFELFDHLMFDYLGSY